jgi:hypothetical protein
MQIKLNEYFNPENIDLSMEEAVSFLSEEYGFIFSDYDKYELEFKKVEGCSREAANTPTPEYVNIAMG